jgi:hypothetical protein
MEAFSKLAAALSIPLGLLNILGGIVAGIWLAVLGKWGIIGYGVAALFVSGFGLGIAMMPGLLFAAPAAMLHEKGNKLGFYFFGFLGALYTVAVLTAWCIAVLYFFARQANADSIIPILLWSYGVATGPIGWLAQKAAQGGGGEGEIISTFFAQVAYVIVILAVFFFSVSLGDVIILFGAIMVVGLVFQFRIASQLERLSHYE